MFRLGLTEASTFNRIAKKFVALFLVTAFLAPPAASQNLIEIGVLAMRGDTEAIDRWSPMADYLSGAVPGYRFAIKSLAFDEITAAVRQKAVQFVLVNSAIYVNLEAEEGISRIATMKNRILGQSVTSFGGIVFVRKDRNDIQTFSDLKGKRVAAVDETSMGGWIAAWREFVHDGIEPHDDFASLEFLGTHDAVVRAVLEGRVEAGTVRTDTLERMVETGDIVAGTFRILSGPCCRQNVPRDITEFPFLLSTALYPEWPFAKLASTPNGLAEKVAAALLSLSPDSPAARKAQINGWTIPANYQAINDAFKDLKIGPYAQIGKVTVALVLRQFWREILLVVSFILLLVVTLVYIISLNRRLKQSEEKLRDLATHDPLTRLPNRRLFEEYTEKCLANAGRTGVNLGFMFVDLDGFKKVNDTFGHDVGDEVLVESTARLERALRKGDFVARSGGDEFLVLIVDMKGTAILEEIAGRLISSLSKPIFVRGREAHIGASVGISCFPKDGQAARDLLKRADEALYSVKNSGRGSFLFFGEDAEVLEQRTARLAEMSDVREIVQRA